MEKSSEKTKVLLDTNFIVLTTKKSFNLQSELDRIIGRKYELVTIPKVKEELKKIGREKIGNKVINEFDIKTVNAPDKTADQAIIDMEKKNMVVCTNDKELKNRLRKKGTPVIYLRGNKKLELKGEIK